MTILKTQSAKRNEKGIALIFTLIMLSLLMMLALSFALDSMFEQKAAYNSANSSSSGFMTKVQLNQILLLMENDQANFAGDKLYSVDSTVTPYNVAHTDMLKSLLAVSGVLEETGTFLTTSPLDVKWNYIRDDNLGTSRIVGRTAFVIVPKEKIPLNSLLSETVDESGALATSPEVYFEKRIGKEVSEINVRSAYVDDAGYAITPAITDQLNWNTVGGGTFTGAWSSYSYLFNTIGISDGNFQQNFINSFDLDTEDDKEGFWVDKDHDNILDSASEFFKRFDLTRDDWTMSEARSLGYMRTALLLTSTGLIPTLPMQLWEDTDSISYNDDPVSYSRGLPWLAYFGYQADGTAYTGADLIEMQATFSSVAERRQQIASNLKDYCDSDDLPTSDQLPSNWLSSTAPVFTGNERTPYINKIGVRVKSILTNTPNGANTDTSITVSVKPYIGLIDIYRSQYLQGIYVSITGTVKVSVNFNGFIVPMTFNISNLPSSSTELTFLTSNWATGHSDFLGGGATSDQSLTLTAAAPLSAEVRVTEVIITKVVLHDSASIGYDYVKTLSLTPTNPFVTFINSSTVGTKYGWFGFEVNDPRQNLNADDWVILTPQRTDADTANTCFAVTATAEGEPNAGNTNAVYPSGVEVSPARVAANTVDADLYDPEGSSDPAAGNLSTAYIRNASMESPWELGFIHRGKMWQTLNLKKYDSSKAVTESTIGFPSSTACIAGGGLYTDGDANILDQVKMTKEAKSPTKINIGAQKDGILNALFSQIQLACVIIRDNTNFPLIPASHMTIDSMTVNGTTTPVDLTSAAYTTMRTNIKGISSLITRAGVADNLSAFAGSTDAAQEELIGKMINLSKAGRNGDIGSGSFTIIIVAQTIKDIGGPGATSITVYKVPADGSAAKPVACTIGTFDITNGADGATWKDDAYGDEITAVQKIIAEVYRSADGTITVKSFQYVE